MIYFETIIGIELLFAAVIEFSCVWLCTENSLQGRNVSVEINVLQRR